MKISVANGCVQEAFEWCDWLDLEEPISLAPVSLIDQFHWS